MAMSFDVKSHTCAPESLPRLLWRVTHASSQHRTDSVTGELRAARIIPISDEATLKQEAANHFKWSKEAKPSCFLSVFADEEHARNWARGRDGDEVTITRIITAMLPADVCVFDATSLSETLGITHKFLKDEFILLHRIPWQSLGLQRSINDDAPTEDLRDMIRALRDSNDSFAVWVQRIDDDKKLAVSSENNRNSEEAVTRLNNVLVRGYPAALRDMISALVHTLHHHEKHSGRWITEDPFTELSSLLVWKINEMEGKVERLESGDEILPEPERKRNMKKKVVRVRRKREDPATASLAATGGPVFPDISRLTLLTD